MSIYFPILSSNKIYKTSTIVYNFPPNDYENVKKRPRYLSLIWIEEDIWRTKVIAFLKPFESKEIFYDLIKPKRFKNNLLIMSLTDKPLATFMNSLPINNLPRTTPSWRSTVSLHIKDSTSSFQGEIIPLPEKSSLLSFSTFLQRKEHIKNYLIFMNLELKPNSRIGTLLFTTVNNPNLINMKIKVKSNNYNLIDLNKINIESDQIMICFSKNISGIPLFLSYSDKNDLISLEHTHPPGSFLINDNRNKFQKIIKRRWLDRFYK